MNVKLIFLKTELLFMLGMGQVRDIQLSNPTRRPLSYAARLEGAADSFTLEASLVKIDPGQSTQVRMYGTAEQHARNFVADKRNAIGPAVGHLSLCRLADDVPNGVATTAQCSMVYNVQVPVRFKPSTALPKLCRLVLMSRRDNSAASAATLVFLLKGQADVRVPLKQVETSAPLYQLSVQEFTITNPFPAGELEQVVIRSLGAICALLVGQLIVHVDACMHSMVCSCFALSVRACNLVLQFLCRMPQLSTQQLSAAVKLAICRL